MAKKIVRISVSHPTEGEVDILMDSFVQKRLLQDRKLSVQVEYSRDVPPYVKLSGNNEFGPEYAGRVILQEFGNSFDPSRNVSYKDGNHYNLTLENLYQVSRPR